MREAQKREAADGLIKPTSKKHEYVPPGEKLDPVLARLTPEDRAVGWQYRLVTHQYSSNFKLFFFI